ncbi:Modification methylase ScrFIB (M.ScrFI-B) (M.ScrFIB) (Cytosine-specific methyltransferase ScrFIB), partial [Durusdinium trenchii]
ARSVKEGEDWISGAKAKTPKVDFYTGGFECQAGSSSRDFSVRHKDGPRARSGMSSRTLAKSLEYIRHHRPAYVILENVANKGTERILSLELRKLSYVTQGLFINSCSFGLPQSRTRLYMLAVDPYQVDLIGLMLPEDDPAVQAFLLALESSNQKRRKSEEDLLQNMAEGLSWP